jgi:hypothetical protein
MRESQKMNSHDEHEDFFAPGQFKDLSDSEMLTAPPFEKQKAGGTTDGMFELKIELPKTIVSHYIKESERQNIKTEFFIRKLLERLSKFMNEPCDDRTLPALEALKTVQRVYGLTPCPTSMVILLRAGYSSAYAITQIPQDEFIDSLRGLMPVHEARQIYDAAIVVSSRRQT